ncbi:cytochrome P450 [Spinellus fusiger]|nr:cytochrome P450 [Spinellus fusiger]
MIDLLKERPFQTAGVVAVGTALYALYSSSKDKETGSYDKIPMPKGKYPYIDHLPLLGENSFLKMHEWHKELGPILHIKMGVQDFVFISDPIIAHEVFNVNGNITTLRPSNKFADAFRSLNVVLRICLGTRMDSTEDPAFKDIVDIMQLSMLYGSADKNIEAYIPALSFISYIQSKDKTKRDFIDNLRNLTYRKMINQALEGDVDCLVKRMKESEDIMYDEDDMVVFFNKMINGGIDTVSVTLSWAFALLSHHPEIQRKICDEIDAFIAKYKRLPTFTEREEFPYIISVQREIMRFYPLTPYGVPHIAEQDCNMHRNPDVYPDPDKFIPERFINNTSTFHVSSNGNIKERDQYNFGWGRRICPGIYLAETGMFLAYTSLWARCTVEPALDSNDSPVYADIESFVDCGLVIMPKPYKVRFVERPDKLL